MQPIYAIVSESHVRAQEKLEELLKEFKGVDYDLVTHDLEESSLAILLEELNTIPFLNDHKIVVVKKPVFLIKPQSYDEKLIESFKKYMINPIETTTLIFMIEKIKDLNPDLRNVIEKNSIVKTIEEIKDEDVKTHLEKLFMNDGFKYDNYVVEELLFRTKGNVERLDMEIEKLETYKNDEKIITLEDVKTLVSKDLDDNIFDLVNAVVEANRKKAIDIYNDLMVLNEDESKIISLLISKFNELYQTKNLMDHGYNKNEIAQIYNVKPGRVYYMMKSASGVSLDSVKKNINTLIDLDYKIKSGQIDKAIALELFLLK